METKFSVNLAKIISELELDVAYMPNEPEKIHVSSKDITRPGLELTGYLDFFDNSRIILFGNTENSYLNKFSSEQRTYVIERIFALQPPAIIITRGIIPYSELMSAADKAFYVFLQDNDSVLPCAFRHDAEPADVFVSVD